jgi:hypothetical protein
MASVTSTSPEMAVHVTLRRMPYPYRAMMAICSDLDETPDADVYFEIARYLNTSQLTRMGCGLGLEVGNTIYFDMPAGQFSYWNSDDRGRQMVHALIHSGHIDCLHSYGDLATTRGHAERALNELYRRSSRIEAWVDHAVAPTNFGADIMHGFGDVPGHRAYHADLTCVYGVKYVWRGRITSVIAQNATRSFRGIWDSRHSFASTRTVAKEYAKGVLSQTGNVKYAMHAPNEVLHQSTLRDDREIYEFLRANPCAGGVENGATAAGLAKVLSPRMLENLVAREGSCILYTHLGKIRNRQPIFEQSTRDALTLLAAYSENRSILVGTTRRVLGYCRAIREVRTRVEAQNGDRIIHVDTRGVSATDCDGLSFYTDESQPWRVKVDGREVAVVRNSPDHTGRPSISIPWRKLEFPQL